MVTEGFQRQGGASDASTWEISPYTVFGLLGFTFYLAWMFMLFASPTVSPEHVRETLLGPSFASQDSFPRLTLLLALCASLFTAWRLSDALSSKRGTALLVIGGLLLNTLAFAMLQIAAGHIVVLHIAWAMTGISQACAILLWSTFLSSIGDVRILMFISLSIAAAATVALLMSLLKPFAAHWIGFALFPLTMACFCYIHYRLTGFSKALEVRARVSDERSSIPLKSALSVMLYSVIIGFALCFIVGSGAGIFGAAAAATAVICAGATVALDSALFHRITESLLIRFHLPFLVIGIAPLFFTNLTAQIIACAFMLYFFMIIYIINLSALSEHVRIDHLSAIRVFGYGRGGNALGVAFGSVAYYFAFHESFPFAGGEQSSTTAILLLLFGLLVFGASFVFEDHYPFSSERRLSETNTNGMAHALPANDLRALSSLNARPPEQLGQETQGGFWRRRCMALADACDLSPQER
ncbi:MAG: hypothetical protein LBH64_02855, partial [Coriobacteriales bacterium]|nr:hypothetical protein [Coriobacteriales bacterium]